MIDLLQMSFFRHAFFMCLLLSVLYGILSFFIVIRRTAFLGVGIAHTAFGGVAMGILMGLNPFYTSLGFCMIAALLMGRLSKHEKISYDTSIGIFFSFAMALGALLISLRKAYTFDLSGYLFGNILGITGNDLFLVIVTFVLFIPFMMFFFQKLLFMSFDETVAKVSGVRTDLLDSVMLLFQALIIVISIKVVGIILVSALVVLPASFGLLISNHYRKVIFGSVIYTLCMMCSGLVLSYYVDTPPGATIVVLAALVYFLGVGVKLVVKRV